MSTPDDPVPLSFGDAIRHAVRNCGWTPHRIAQASEGRLGGPEIHNFLIGRRNVGLEKLNVIAELVGLEVRSNGSRGRLAREPQLGLPAKLGRPRTWKPPTDLTAPSTTASDSPPDSDQTIIREQIVRFRMCGDRIYDVDVQIVTKPLDDSTGTDGPGQS